MFSCVEDTHEIYRMSYRIKVSNYGMIMISKPISSLEDDSLS